MKKVILIIALSLFSLPVFAQVTTYTNNAPNPVANGVGNMMGNNRMQNIMPTTMPPGTTSGAHITTLEERRQQQFAKQQQDLAKSGIQIRNIAPKNNGVQTINPSNMQTMPQSVAPSMR